MNSSHNGKYFMISYAISEVRFNDNDDFTKTYHYDLSRHIRPRCVTQEAITYYLWGYHAAFGRLQWYIDSSFNDLLLTFIDHTRGRLRREHKILLIFPKMFSWLLPYFEITLDGHAKEISNALTNTRLQLVITKGYEVRETTIEG